MGPVASAGLLLLPVAAGTRFLAGRLNTGFLSAAICGSMTFAAGLLLFWFLAFDAELKARLVARTTGLSAQILARLKPARP